MRILDEDGTRVRVRTEIGVNSGTVIEIEDAIAPFKTIALRSFCKR